MGNKEKKVIRKVVFPVIGIVMLVFGVTLILSWWSYVIVFFKGVGGMMLAVVGLFILCIVKK